MSFGTRIWALTKAGCLLGLFGGAQALAAGKETRAEATELCPVKRSPLAAFPDCVPLPLDVAAYAVIDRIEKVDDAGETFNVQFDVRLRWVDPRLAFDGAETLEVRREYMAHDAVEKLKEIWRPEIAFTNAAEDVKEIDSALAIQADGKVVWNRRIVGKFRASYDLDDFPFDKQDLAMKLTIANLPSRTVRFVHRDEDRRRSAMASGLDDDIWAFSDLALVPTEQRTINGDRASQLVIGFKAERHAAAYIPQVFLPLLVTLFLPLLALWIMDTEIHERINWLVTGVFSLIALNFSISLQYPALGPNSLVMKFFWIGYGLQFLMFSVMLLMYNGPVTDKIFSKWTAGSLRSWMYWSIPTVTAMMMAWSLLNAAS